MRLPLRSSMSAAKRSPEPTLEGVSRVKLPVRLIAKAGCDARVVEPSGVVQRSARLFRPVASVQLTDEAPPEAQLIDVKNGKGLVALATCGTPAMMVAPHPATKSSLFHIESDLLVLAGFVLLKAK
jgi:hypothetical protein